MIDQNYPEAVRYRPNSFSFTHEFRCPVCGCTASDRSWNVDKQIFVYHCSCCGHDTELTWTAAAVWRAKGEIEWVDADGNRVKVPDGITIPPIPADPNNNAYEDWEIMSRITAGSGAPVDTPTTGEETPSSEP